jgi:hypothetical protein
MTGTTANFALPYPDGSDRPCDFAEQWCDFTQAVDAVFDRFQATLDRTVPMIPLAVLSLTDQVTMLAFNNIPYDTVAMDSAGWTAVDIDNTMISPDMAGVLSFSASALMTQAQVVGAFILDPIDSRASWVEPELPFGDQMDTNTCPIGIPLAQPVEFSDGGWIPGATGIRNSVGVNNIATVTVTRSNYSIYWHSDGGTV